jgi:hypothetical protein
VDGATDVSDRTDVVVDQVALRLADRRLSIYEPQPKPSRQMRSKIELNPGRPQAERYPRVRAGAATSG